MKRNVITLCSGYDSQCMALDRLKADYGDDYELVAWCEIDDNAIRAHNAVYPQWADRNLKDMTKVNWEEWHNEHGNIPIDLLTYSTPCTDISNAGQQKGLEEGSETRSSILWYTRNAILALRPKYLLMENVKALVSDKFRPYFLKWLKELEDYGYESFSQVLNATDYGIPQNRERIFVISIRRDDDSHITYKFPKPFPLEKCVGDILEDEVDESYYLKDEQVEKFIKLIQGEADVVGTMEEDMNDGGEEMQAFEADAY